VLQIQLSGHYKSKVALTISAYAETIYIDMSSEHNVDCLLRSLLAEQLQGSFALCS